MRQENIWKQLALGAAAGLAGTVVLRLFQAAEQKWVAETSPPMTMHPGEFMIHQAEKALPRQMRQRVHGQVEPRAANWLGLVYGMTFGALYAAARGARLRAILWDSLGLGLVTWAAGYLGWLPATGLMPPVWKHKPRQIAAPLAEHAAFGLGTVAGYRLMRRARSATT